MSIRSRDAALSKQHRANRITRRVIRFVPEYQQICAQATGTRATGETESGYDYREPMEIGTARGRFLFFDPPGSLTNRCDNTSKDENRE